MKEVGPGYPFYTEYLWLKNKAIFYAPFDLDIVIGETNHYNLPDFRLVWKGIRIVGVIPRPQGVSLLLEFDKFLKSRHLYPSGEIDAFEDAMGALPLLGNRLLVIHSCDDVDEEYLDKFLEVGIALYLEEIKRRHPNFP